MSRRIPELVQSVLRGEVRHEYLDQLQARARGTLVGEDALAAAQREILQEMADALCRTQRRLDEAFGRLRALDETIRQIEQEGRTGQRRRLAELTQAYNAQRSLAKRRLWELFVHREALGLLRHDQLREEYRVPPRR